MGSALVLVRRRGAIAEGDAVLRDLAADLEEAVDPSVLGERLGLDLDPWQKTLASTPKRQTIVLCSRQAGKSTSTALKTLSIAVNEPKSIILLLSPGERQSKLLFKKVKELYGLMAPPVATETDNELSLVLANGSEIHALPGKGGTVRGFSGVRLIVVDEASQVPDDLMAAVRPMLAVSGGEIILLSTPFGKRGFFHATWVSSEHNPAWERIGPIPATAIPRISAQFLADERKELPKELYEQEYECKFLDLVNQVFSLEQIVAAMADPAVTPLFGELLAPSALSDPTVTPLLATF